MREILIVFCWINVGRLKQLLQWESCGSQQLTLQTELRLRVWTSRVAKDYSTTMQLRFCVLPGLNTPHRPKCTCMGREIIYDPNPTSSRIFKFNATHRAHTTISKSNSRVALAMHSNLMILMWWTIIATWFYVISLLRMGLLSIVMQFAPRIFTWVWACIYIYACAI